MWKSGVPSGGATVDVKLPRFETNTDLDLVKIMSRLGMPKAFTVSAEFPDFCNVPTFIGLMKQVARIKVSEEGTEADRNEELCNPQRAHSRQLPRRPSVYLYYQRTVDWRHLLHRTLYGLIKSARREKVGCPQ